MRSLHDHFLLHAILNAYWESLTFELPPIPAGSHQRWRRCMDTALASRDDIYLWKDSPPVTGSSYLVQPRSVVVLALMIDL